MVALDNSSKARLVVAFLRSFAPQQWGQLLFVFGALALFCAPFASWSPPFPREVLEVPSSPSPFFEHIPPYSADASVLAWKAWHRFLLVPQILLIAAGLLALAFSFAPSEFFRRRRWGWVYAICLFALGVIWLRLFLWASGSGSVLETPGQRWSRFLGVVPDLASGVATGMQVLLTGLLLLGIGLWRARRGKVSLPVRFNEVSARQLEPAHQASAAAEVTTFSLIVLASIGIFSLVPRSLYVFDLWPSGGVVSVWRILWSWLFPLLPTGFPILCGLALRGRPWKGELAGMFRLGPLREYGVALLVPFLVLIAPQLLAAILSKVSWELEQFFGYRPLSFTGFPYFPWLELSVFPPALLEEMAWRAYLLSLAIRLVGVRRGIFVVALLWGSWHFPSDVGGSALQVLRAVTDRLLFACIHSVALSWLYLRSRSALAPGLMHGVMNFLWFWAPFPASYADELIGWVRLALWGVAGYLLFKYWPPQGTDAAPRFSP